LPGAGRIATGTYKLQLLSRLANQTGWSAQAILRRHNTRIICRGAIAPRGIVNFFSPESFLFKKLQHFRRGALVVAQIGIIRKRNHSCRHARTDAAAFLLRRIATVFFLLRGKNQRTGNQKNACQNSERKISSQTRYSTLMSHSQLQPSNQFSMDSN
jgi:hypothetical protein